MLTAVKVAGVPWHAGLAEHVMEILTGRFGEKLILMGFDIAGLPVAHITSDVSWHATTSPELGT